MILLVDRLQEGCGTYLVPRLVRGGHEVIAMSRGTRDPYQASPQWGSVTRVAIDRDEEDREGTFGARIAALRPDVVIDLICFTAASARQLADALRPSRPLLIYGSLDALHEALAWLVANGQADVGGQEF